MNISEQLIADLYSKAESQTQSSENGTSFVSDYIVANEILKSDKSFRKDYGAISDFMLSRFNTDGEDWRRRKNISQKQFAQASISENLSAIHETAARSFTPGALSDGDGLRRLSIHYAAMNFFRLFGEEEVPEGFVDWVEKVRPFVQRLQVKTLVGEAANAFEPAEKQQLLSELGDIIAPRAHLFEHFKSSLHDPNAALEESAMLFFGGVESTATTILWCMEMLGRALPYQEIVRAEDRDGRIRLIDSFVNEVMRRFPAVPMIVRVPVENWESHGRRFEKDRPIIISIIGVHHDARAWADPFTFDFRRKEFLEKSVKQGSFMPFSRGLRTCAGARLANEEIRAAALHLVENYIIKQPSEKLGYDYGLTLNPTTYRHIQFQPLNQ